MKSKQRASWGSSGRISIRDYFSSLISRFEKDNVTILASGMVYSTLIALVPCITFFMFFFSVLGVLDPFLQVLSDFLVEVFGSRTGNTISQAITSMTKNAGTMGAFGMVSFIVTFLFLINKFWTVVNKIYRTSVEQNQFKKFLTFLVVLIIGTILMGAFLSLKTKFSDWYSTVFQITPLADGQKVLEWFVSKTVIWAVLFCLMMSVPNTTVRASAALISSALVTVAIVLLDWLFSFATKQMVSYSIIYGSLGVVFVFLLWIFILWMIVFMGFESCFVIQFRPSTKEKKASATPLNQISDVIAMMTYIGSRYSGGFGAASMSELERVLVITNIHLTNDINLMEKSGLLIPAGASKDSFVPGRPLSEIRVSQIIEAVFGSAGSDSSDDIARSFRQGGLDSVGSITLEDLVLKQADKGVSYEKN